MELTDKEIDELRRSFNNPQLRREDVLEWSDSEGVVHSDCDGSPTYLAGRRMWVYVSETDDKTGAK